MMRKEAEIEASRDPLTNLFNRRRLDQRAEELWHQPNEADTEAAVVVLDIDHFKAFNDRYGHLVGDLCLKKVGEILSASTQFEDELPVRFGGEEFVVLPPDVALSDAIRHPERLRCAIENLAMPHDSSETANVITATFGVMSGPVAHFTLKGLIQGADQALYAAKQAGRNRVWPPLVKPTENSELIAQASLRA